MKRGVWFVALVLVALAGLVASQLAYRGRAPTPQRKPTMSTVIVPRSVPAYDPSDPYPQAALAAASAAGAAAALAGTPWPLPDYVGDVDRNFGGQYRPLAFACVAEWMKAYNAGAGVVPPSSFPGVNFTVEIPFVGQSGAFALTKSTYAMLAGQTIYSAQMFVDVAFAVDGVDPAVTIQVGSEDTANLYMGTSSNTPDTPGRYDHFNFAAGVAGQKFTVKVSNGNGTGSGRVWLTFGKSLT